MEKILVILLIIIFVLIIVMMFFNQHSLSDIIVKFIDERCNKSNRCIIFIEEITDFDWDKMVIFRVGSSNQEISRELGIEFTDSVDLMSGIVFAYQNKIVYSELIPYNPEKPTTFEYYPEVRLGYPNIRLFTPSDAIFEGRKIEIDKKYYYVINPLENY